MNFIICYLSDKPVIGWITSTVSFLFGLQFNKETMDIVIFLLQILAFSVSIFAGILTIYAQLIKMKKNCNKNEYNKNSK